MQEKESYAQKHYTVSELSAEVLRMETGLPTKEVFNIVVLHALRFKDCIVYYSGWKVESIKFEDQILITLMKPDKIITTYSLRSFLAAVLQQ